ncbi:MAG: hypothetical protein R3F08_02725 [Dokdonella sp.]|nr:hypothetical protein [Dokdonella sp.]MCB1569724.1 hypothetical protein [Xanthomonadales bacterium]MCB1575157.1 hypothetical protein [Xanthomonadales bacterium]MCB1576805.1 hypothetical protein [Xanthomonadales bacterium]
MNVFSQQQKGSVTNPLVRWAPLLLAIAVVWLATRGLKRLFWTGFVLAWALHGSGGRFPFGF